MDLREVPDGTHTYTATATDRAGNVSGRSEELVVVVERPVDTGITSDPPGIVRTATVSFGFNATEVGATFECKLDGGTFEPCESPTEYTGLSEGPHTFWVRAIDSAGKLDETPASQTFTLDLPDPPVVRDDLGSTGVAAAVSNAFISQYASSRTRTPTRLYRFDTTQSIYRFTKDSPAIAGPVNAIGYRSTDSWLYGYRLTGSPGIVRIDPETGGAVFLGIPQGLPPAKSYFAGDVSPDGSTYYLHAGKSRVLWVVDLTTLERNEPLQASSVELSSPIDVADFAVSPTDGNLYSVAANGRLLRVAPATGQVTVTSVPGLKPGLYGAAWFTANGDLIAYQNAVSRTRGVMTWITDPAGQTAAPRVVSKQPGPRTYGNDGAAHVTPPNLAGLEVEVDVLANDGDPAGTLDRRTLQIGIVDDPLEGTATVNADKTITYTSRSTYDGEDWFTYEVCTNDAPTLCPDAKVRVTSEPVPSSAASPNE